MKRSLALLFSFLLVFPTALGTASAKEKTQDLSLEEKIFEIDESDLSTQVKKQEFIQALEDATHAEKTEYLEKVGKRVQNTLNEVDVELGENQEIDLGMGTTIELESSDVVEAPEDEFVKTSGYDFSKGNILQKKYGARRFTCRVSVKSLGITLGSLVLRNHYTVGSFGLKMRYASDNGTSGTDPLMIITSSSTSVPDGKAVKVGHDMNARGSYKWKLGISGIYKSFTSEIYSTIKLSKLNKKKKFAVVYQNYKFTE
ncbi:MULTISPECIES: hypothetical protein [Bacillus]|uniref:Uncharacterized protein n=1 Tax=Bacillus glycinifermentans TaxID=1664069 RepID=A0AAJ4D1U5_9BACI|nr:MULTISPECIES: hypothetical protein [Bacillus]KKB74129.1 hypothetical protein TH62_08460 [Bacillus sp. TH008]MBU8786644.1 hypothetical protein [Bacillus glycinifermentans]MDU0070474.1 hypothetical protein [Bacillus sp. IG6]MED8018339.1 hypothetical protein [Bacillus glycinifermentans]NUJ16563.1 hypothetical protein [Bacillus glycinifermentans]